MPSRKSSPPSEPGEQAQIADQEQGGLPRVVGRFLGKEFNAAANGRNGFTAGMAWGAFLLLLVLGYVAVSVVQKNPMWAGDIIAAKFVEQDAFPNKLFLRLYDLTEVPEKQVSVRELTLHGSRKISGSYRNQWNNDTGLVTGFVQGDVIELAYVADPDEHGQPRHGVGSIKVERVHLENKKDPIFVGYEEGCDCQGDHTTAVAAILSESATPPSWITDVTDKKPTIALTFARPSDVLQRLSELAKSGKQAGLQKPVK